MADDVIDQIKENVIQGRVTKDDEGLEEGIVGQPGVTELVEEALAADINVSDIIDTYVLRIGLEQGRFSFATAVGFFKSVVNLTLLLLANTLSKRLTHRGLF